MMIGITGTPGTGKSSIASELRKRGNVVVALTSTVEPYILGEDRERDTRIIEEERWALEFPRIEGFVEGHLAHLLMCDLIVLLRCRPDVLSSRLKSRGYSEAKVLENVEAEACDVILIETLDAYDDSRVLEIDTTDMDIPGCVGLIEQFSRGEIPPSSGSIDWSLYLGETL